jgi:PAS domain S-box-containing protein
MTAVPDPELAGDAVLLGEAFEHAGIAMAVYSDDARYIACNQAFCELTGYSRDEIRAMRVGESLGWDPGQNLELFHDLVAARVERGTGGLRRKSGERLTCDVQAVSTTITGLPYLIALYTERRDPPDG